MPEDALTCRYCGTPSSQVACRCHLDLMELEPYSDLAIAALEREDTTPTKGCEA